MGWTFRKRIKIAPGLTVNLGKRGISTSIGGPGARLTLGKQSRATVGLPGTGLSASTRLNDRSPSTGTMAEGHPRHGPIAALVLAVLALLIGMGLAGFVGMLLMLPLSVTDGIRGGLYIANSFLGLAVGVWAARRTYRYARSTTVRFE